MNFYPTRGRVLQPQPHAAHGPSFLRLCVSLISSSYDLQVMSPSRICCLLASFPFRAQNDLAMPIDNAVILLSLPFIQGIQGQNLKVVSVCLLTLSSLQIFCTYQIRRNDWFDYAILF